MRPSYYLFFLIFIVIINLSSSDGVPQPVAGAPGDSTQSCKACHNSSGTYVPSIEMTFLNKDSVATSQYTPGETYQVKVKVSATNNPKSFGFQMVGLTGTSNNNVGTWTKLGDKVKSEKLTVSGKSRTYLVQSSPKTDGVFSAEWKAPDTDEGDIIFYFAGLAVNLNGRDSGDNNVTGKKTITPATSASQDLVSNIMPFIFPNPTVQYLNVRNLNHGHFIIYNYKGERTCVGEFDNEPIDVSMLTQGIYELKCIDDENRNTTLTFIKL